MDAAEERLKGWPNAVQKYFPSYPVLSGDVDGFRSFFAAC